MELDISEPHERMLEALTDEHGEEILTYLGGRMEAEIHASFQNMRQGTPQAHADD